MLKRSAENMFNRWLISGMVIICSFCVASCRPNQEVKGDSLGLSVARDSIGDFHRFLDALQLLVSQDKNSLNLEIGSSERTLSFISMDGFPATPFLIHVSREEVATGSGPSRTVLTNAELQARLTKFTSHVEDANFGYGAAVMLISDRDVSGEFGLSILTAISDSGVETIVLPSRESAEVKPDSLETKPSSP